MAAGLEEHGVPVSATRSDGDHLERQRRVAQGRFRGCSPARSGTERHNKVARARDDHVRALGGRRPAGGGDVRLGSHRATNRPESHARRRRASRGNAMQLTLDTLDRLTLYADLQRTSPSRTTSALERSRARESSAPSTSILATAVRMRRRSHGRLRRDRARADGTDASETTCTNSQSRGPRKDAAGRVEARRADDPNR